MHLRVGACAGNTEADGRVVTHSSMEQAGGLRVKSRTGRIGNSVANSSPPLSIFLFFSEKKLHDEPCLHFSD